MLTFTDLRQAQLTGPTFLTIGNFDGLHRGHQLLLERLRTLAQHQVGGQGKSALITFDPHPLSVLRPELQQQLLTTPSERLMLAAHLGIDVGVLLPFTPEFAKLDARSFVMQLKEHLGLAGMVVGPDFALGRNRGGDIPALRELGAEMDFFVEVLEPVEWAGKPARSSLIRQMISEGDVSSASELLGRHYRVCGPVTQGDQRGRTIGIPTANLRVAPNKLLPDDGVYATIAHLCLPTAAYSFKSVTNIGVRPTVDGIHHRVETHLLDFPPHELIDNLYGQVLCVDFVQRLRGERRFLNVEALVAQIRSDIRHGRAVLASAMTPKSDLSQPC